MRFDEDADATNGKFLHQPHTKAKRARLPRTLRTGRAREQLSGDILLAKSG
jgi:hypothetical protein